MFKMSHLSKGSEAPDHAPVLSSFLDNDPRNAAPLILKETPATVLLVECHQLAFKRRSCSNLLDISRYFLPLLCSLTIKDLKLTNTHIQSTVTVIVNGK